MKIKKIFLILFALIGFSAYSADYDYMVIKELDGSESFFKSDGLKFKVVGDNFIAEGAEGEKSFSFANLSYIAFSTEPTGIDTIFSSENEVELFSVSGEKIGVFSSAADASAAISQSGVYILKTKAKTVKMIIKK